MTTDFVGEYEILEQLGSGSFASAFRVQKDNNFFAFKRLRENSPIGSELRFENELWALTQLSHPNLPHFISSGVHDNQPYIIMTLAEGQSLRARMSKSIGERGPFGDTWVLRIISKLLDAIVHMGEKGITHRDIKDANVICNDDASKVMLVDFGFCKGSTQPVDADSFYQVGAPRYSPPRKLRHPSVTHPTHDVFAIGVLAYLLLTDRYPWSVSPDQDHGFLAGLMETQPPLSIRELNPFVSNEICELISKMLIISDSQRVSPSEAKDIAFEILQSSNTMKPYPESAILKLEKVTRDPVHGDIRMTGWETKITDTPLFQRLRHIKQLGFANLVFNGAQHTRFSHSVGTMHVADQILQSVAIASGDRLDSEERILVRAYALIHDLPHAPFGHTIEDELGFFPRHDANPSRMRRLSDRHPELKNILNQTSLGKLLLEEMLSDQPTSPLAFARQVVNGSAGADVLDYVDRDALFCGVDHKIDTAIFRYFRAEASNSASGKDGRRLFSKLYGSHGLRIDADFAIEILLLQRYALFLKIYSHPVKLSAGAMLGKALQYVSDDLGNESLEKVIELMGDDELLLWLKSYKSRSEVPELASDLILRRIYKVAYISNPLGDDINNDTYSYAKAKRTELKLSSPSEREIVEAKIAQQAGVRSKDVILYWPDDAPGLQKARYHIQKRPGDMPGAPLEKKARQMAERHLALWNIYVFVHPSLDQDKRERVTTAAEVILNHPNSLNGISKSR